MRRPTWSDVHVSLAIMLMDALLAARCAVDWLKSHSTSDEVFFIAFGVLTLAAIVVTIYTYRNMRSK